MFERTTKDSEYLTPTESNHRQPNLSWRPTRAAVCGSNFMLEWKGMSIRILYGDALQDADQARFGEVVPI